MRLTVNNLYKVEIKALETQMDIQPKSVKPYAFTLGKGLRNYKNFQNILVKFYGV